MMKIASSLSILLCLVCGLPGFAVGEEREPDLTLDVWPEGAPGETGDVGPEVFEKTTTGKSIIRVSNVSEPTISVFRPPAEKDTGASVLICPGGGYHILAWDLEGLEVAEWLNGLGITGIVLKYRVPRREGRPKEEPPLQDAQRALSLIRSRADEWNLDPNKIGILGFSAGGNLSINAATKFSERAYEPIDKIDQVSCRPDFACPIYAAYLLGEGESAIEPKWITVPGDAPPFFMVHTFDDGRDGQRAATHVGGPLLFAFGLRKADVPFELHVYPKGGHGYGLRPSEDAVSTWPARCERWFRTIGVLPTE